MLLCTMIRVLGAVCGGSTGGMRVGNGLRGRGVCMCTGDDKGTEERYIAGTFSDE
jgi:hypothetical protein